MAKNPLKMAMSKAKPKPSPQIKLIKGPKPPGKTSGIKMNDVLKSFKKA